MNVGQAPPCKKLSTIWTYIETVKHRKKRYPDRQDINERGLNILKKDMY
jgi:hypothetical protein